MHGRRETSEWRDAPSTSQYGARHSPLHSCLTGGTNGCSLRGSDSATGCVRDQGLRHSVHIDPEIVVLVQRHLAGSHWRRRVSHSDSR